MPKATSTPAYSSVHVRLLRHRGPARQFRCVGCCVKRAEHWAYDHRDPDELLSNTGLRYSNDMDHYIALCRTCHKRFDLLAARLREGREVQPKFVKTVQHYWQLPAGGAP